MKKLKVLFIGDGGAPTGFATVMHNIIENMDLKKFEVHHIAINYKGDPHPFPWRMYPAELARDYLGINRIKEFTNMGLRGIFILNDPWVIARYLKEIKDCFRNKIPPIIVYFPVDSLDLSEEWFKDFDIVSKVVVYTKFAKNETLKVYNDNEIDIIPHGIDPKSFYKINDTKENIRKVVFPGRDDLTDAFILLNANRNQPRKRIDITLEGFKLFCEDKPENVKLYLHMGIKDVGFDILTLSKKLNIDDRIILTNLEYGPQRVSIQRLNLIYNSTDVGINTCLGEGWSLTNMEHAVTGAVQIVPQHSALEELYSDCGILISTDRYLRNQDVLTIGGLVHPVVVAKGMQIAYEHRFENLGEKGMNKFTSPEYNWTNITKNKWNPLFEEYFNANNYNVANSTG